MLIHCDIITVVHLCYLQLNYIIDRPKNCACGNDFVKFIIIFIGCNFWISLQLFNRLVLVYNAVEMNTIVTLFVYYYIIKCDVDVGVVIISYSNYFSWIHPNFTTKKGEHHWLRQESAGSLVKESGFKTLKRIS